MASAEGIEIREARAEDAPLLFQLIRELSEFEKIPHEVIATEDTIRESLFGSVPAAEAALAFRDGAPAGFAVFFANFSTFVGRPGIYLEDIYVRPEHRGAGVGKALLAHLARLARRRKAGRIEFAVLDWNPARKFYERFGARPMDDWILYRLPPDAIARLAEE